MNELADLDTSVPEKGTKLYKVLRYIHDQCRARNRVVAIDIHHMLYPDESIDTLGVTISWLHSACARQLLERCRDEYLQETYYDLAQRGQDYLDKANAPVVAATQDAVLKAGIV